ncbi:MAG: PspC domain-containing protein [Coriobacteriia bacterium]|nr:PspC domain-containing protein [Coriobacteriia bacterium]
MAARLYRSRSDRMIAGVCGGLAEHFGWDPVLVRLAAVALLLVTNGGAGIVYLVMAAVVPEQPTQPEPGGSQEAPPVQTAATEATGESAVPPGDAPAAVPSAEAAVVRDASDRASGRAALWVGGILIVVGAALLADEVLHVDLWRFWPVLLIFAGLRMIARGARR